MIIFINGVIADLEDLRKLSENTTKKNDKIKTRVYKGEKLYLYTI